MTRWFCIDLSVGMLASVLVVLYWSGHRGHDSTQEQADAVPGTAAVRTGREDYSRWPAGLSERSRPVKRTAGQPPQRQPETPRLIASAQTTRSFDSNGHLVRSAFPFTSLSYLFDFKTHRHTVPVSLVILYYIRMLRPFACS